MAYPYYPNYFQPVYPAQYQPQPQPQPQQQNQAQAQQQSQTQNFSFIPVPNEEMVNAYPVAPGNCVTFKIEGKPIVMEKSMGFSQFESPKIERYRLVKEEAQEAHEEPQNGDSELNPILDTIDGIKGEIEAIWKELEGLKNAPNKKPTNAKKEKDGDD